MRPRIAFITQRQQFCPSLDRGVYLAALTTAMPHGPSSTFIRRSSLRDFTSTTETSFEAPFAV
jgi:hypothetical protein